jgi:hypothetical protein
MKKNKLSKKRKKKLETIVLRNIHQINLNLHQLLRCVAELFDNKEVGL